MKKFILRGTHGKELAGLYLGIQLVPKIWMERNDLEYKIRQENEMFLIYVDDKWGVISQEPIQEGDEIKFI